MKRTRLTELKKHKNDFTAFYFNDDNWKNGISIMSKNGFFIKKKSNQVLKVGDKLQFPTGVREITQVESSDQYMRIFLAGKRLNPVDDGFPNKIILIHQKEIR